MYIRDIPQDRLIEKLNNAEKSGDETLYNSYLNEKKRRENLKELGRGIKYPQSEKTDLSQYTLKELYSLWGTSERNWKADNGVEYHRIEAEINSRPKTGGVGSKYAKGSTIKGGGIGNKFTYEIGGL
jgi:hypothetical protein